MKINKQDKITRTKNMDVKKHDSIKQMPLYLKYSTLLFILISFKFMISSNFYLHKWSLNQCN